LLSMVEKNLLEDNFGDARIALRQKLFDHVDGHSAQRLCDVIVKLLGDVR
jgi:hypothetical protein